MSGGEPTLGGVGEALERTDEHGQLEVRLRDAGRGHLHPGPPEDVVPFA